MIKEFDKVWFSDEKKFKSPNKGIVYNYVGTLLIDLSESKLVFQIKKDKYFSLHKVKCVYISRPAFPWLSYLIANLPFLLLLPIFNFVTIIYTLAMLLIGNILGLCVGWFFCHWVVVEYIDDNGKEKKAHFFDGRFGGWSGILSGNKKLYTELYELVK